MSAAGLFIKHQTASCVTSCYYIMLSCHVIMLLCLPCCHVIESCHVVMSCCHVMLSCHFVMSCCQTVSVTQWGHTVHRATLMVANVSANQTSLADGATSVLPDLGASDQLDVLVSIVADGVWNQLGIMVPTGSLLLAIYRCTGKYGTSWAPGTS